MRDDAGMPGLTELPLTSDPGTFLASLDSVRGSSVALIRVCVFKQRPILRCWAGYGFCPKLSYISFIVLPMFFDPPITAPGLSSDDQNQAQVGDWRGASRLGLVQVS